jgi:acetylornithine deacetylase/succinyl-diaminopimelate desuccinylase-like protein
MNAIWAEKLLAGIDRSGVAELVREMVAIPSVNPKDSPDCPCWGVEPGEGALAGWLRERLARRGIEAWLEEIEPGRPNVLARYPAGEARGPVLALNAHIDTVGAYEMGQQAFHPEIRDGRLYGRGAVDDKGGLGCMVAALEALAELRVPLAGQVILTGVIGEEGPPSGSEVLVENGFRADGVIVGEASECRLFTGQRGGQFVRLRTFGKTAHGSLPVAGINAIEHMARLLVAIPSMDLFRRQDPRYGAASVTIGKIQGGVRTNVVPDLCEASLDIRLPPGIQPEEALAAFQAQMQAMGIQGSVEAEETGHPAYLTAPETPIVQAVSAALERAGLPADLDLAPYWSDLAHFHQTGIPGVVLGPGSILQAHSGCEFVALDQLQAAARVYALTALSFCGVQA